MQYVSFNHKLEIFSYNETDMRKMFIRVTNQKLSNPATMMCTYVICLLQSKLTLSKSEVYTIIVSNNRTTWFQRTHSQQKHTSEQSLMQDPLGLKEHISPPRACIDLRDALNVSLHFPFTYTPSLPQ